LGGREAIPTQNVNNTRTRARCLLRKSRFYAQNAVEIEAFSSPFKFDFLHKYARPREAKWFWMQKYLKN
jgi:hypothetical protein